MCGKEFQTKNTRKKYCSEECKNKMKNLKKRERYANNPEIRLACSERGKKYRKNNKDKIKKIQAKYRLEHLEELRKYDRERNKTETRKEWYKNRDKQPERVEYKKRANKLWRQKNKEHINKYKREYEKKRKKEDLNYFLNRWCRVQVRRCLHGLKNKNSIKFLDYTTEQLKQRLEMQFKPDMNWENHGKLWHIDHRKALKDFVFALPDGSVNYHQVYLASCLANLKPIYWWENLSKGSKNELEYKNKR